MQRNSFLPSTGISYVLLYVSSCARLWGAEVTMWPFPKGAQSPMVKQSPQEPGGLAPPRRLLPVSKESCCTPFLAPSLGSLSLHGRPLSNKSLLIVQSSAPHHLSGDGPQPAVTSSPQPTAPFAQRLPSPQAALFTGGHTCFYKDTSCKTELSELKGT